MITNIATLFQELVDDPQSTPNILISYHHIDSHHTSMCDVSPQTYTREM